MTIVTYTGRAMDGRHSKSRRTIARLAALLAIAAVGAIVVLIMLARQPPGWYAAALQFDPAAANDADQKLAGIVSWAAGVQASETRQRLAAASGNPAAGASENAGPITVEFTAAQINSFIRKWFPAAAGSAGQWGDVAVELEDGRIILAGRMGGGSTVLSVPVEPVIDGQGRLIATAGGAHAGRLPIPAAMLSGSIAQARASLQSQLSTWQSQARIDADGIGNPAAANVCMARLCIALLDSTAGRVSPVDPIVMVPFDPSRASRRISVRVEAIAIDSRSITLRLARK